ncbi:MAG TPA: hypothetical protein VHE61_17930 [Opitutaceae bacterium]|nr:hypothetical protein [Opitutaceae bacterium]
MPPTIDPLIGRHFLWLKRVPLDGDSPEEIRWQGVVLGCPQPGFYLVQLMELEKGSHYNQRLVKIEDMLAWQFYQDKQQMIGHWERLRVEDRYRERQLPRADLARPTGPVAPPPQPR